VARVRTGIARGVNHRIGVLEEVVVQVLTDRPQLPAALARVVMEEPEYLQQLLALPSSTVAAVVVELTKALLQVLVATAEAGMDPQDRLQLLPE
jgi:hypothetical protein